MIFRTTGACARIVAAFIVRIVADVLWFSGAKSMALRLDNLAHRICPPYTGTSTAELQRMYDACGRE